MKEILNNTYGIIVYQEQIMQLAQKLAGYTLSEADLMRRAMGKKKRERWPCMKRSSSRARRAGIKQEKAEKIFSLMAQFSDYGFNRSHSVAYAYLAFKQPTSRLTIPSIFMQLFYRASSRCSQGL
jgi:DNA polymerase-3 subunit alpha